MLHKNSKFTIRPMRTIQYSVTQGTYDQHDIIWSKGNELDRFDSVRVTFGPVDIMNELWPHNGKVLLFNINDLPYRIKREFLNSGKMTSKSIFQYRLIRIDYLTRLKIFCKQRIKMRFSGLRERRFESYLCSFISIMQYIASPVIVEAIIRFSLLRRHK